MSRDWRIYVGDMLAAAERAKSYRQRIDRAEFNRHEMAFDAMIRNLELIGEAARQVPDPVRGRAVTIPWTRLVALRNILIHGYFAIDDDIIWDIVSNELSPLISALRLLLESSPVE